MSGIKEALNQPHKFYYEKMQSIFNIVDLLKSSKYVKSAKNEKANDTMTNYYHYFEIKIKRECSYIVVRENKGKLYYFYSIVEEIR